MTRALCILVLVTVLLPVPAGAETTDRFDSVTGKTFTYVVSSSGLCYSPLRDNDADTGRYDIVIIGDGFDASDADQARFTEAARLFSAGLFQVSPYSEFATSINVWMINLVSPESGVTDPDHPHTANTALGCTFTSGSMEISGVAPEALAIAACSVAGIEADAVFVVLHDMFDHDGACADYSTRVAFASDLYPWGTVMGHELGHLIANLGDEYGAPSCYTTSTCVTRDPLAVYSFPYAPGEPNLTTETDPAQVPWADLLENDKLPTTRDNAISGETIGRWEGGGTEWCFGVYRPCEYCLMDGVTGQNPETDTFCPVCSRVLAEYLARYAPVPPL
jgi:IgA Peptidase M64